MNTKENERQNKKCYAQTTNNKNIGIKRMLFIKLNSSNHYNPIDCLLFIEEIGPSDSAIYVCINLYVVQIVVYPFDAIEIQ